MNQFYAFIESLKQNTKRRKRWQKTTSILAACVLAASLIVLSVPAFTLDGDEAAQQVGITLPENTASYEEPTGGDNDIDLNVPVGGDEEGNTNGSITVEPATPPASQGQQGDTPASQEEPDKAEPASQPAAEEPDEAEPAPQPAAEEPVVEVEEPAVEEPDVAIIDITGLQAVRLSPQALKAPRLPGSVATTDILAYTETDHTYLQITSGLIGTRPDTTLKDPAVENGVYQRWTGEALSNVITVPNTDVEAGKVRRVYISFSDLSEDEIEHTFVVLHSSGSVLKPSDDPHYINAETGTFYFKQATGAENVYYFEIPDPDSGSAFELPFDVLFESPDTDGGGVQIWGVVLDEAANANLGTGVMAPADNKVHEANWDISRDTFNITKSAVDKGDSTVFEVDQNSRVKATVGPEFYHDADKGWYTVKNLIYDIDVTRVINPDGPGSKVSAGADYLQSITFTDVLTLPEGAEWNPDILAKINSGYWTYGREGGGSNATYARYVVNGITLVTLYDVYHDIDNYSVSYDEAGGNVILTWQNVNKQWSGNTGDSPWAEMSMGRDNWIKFGDNAIVVRDPGSVGEEWAFDNTVKADEQYTHSGIVHKEDDATLTVSTQEGRIEAAKTHDYTSPLRWGDPVTFTIKAENVGVSPVPITAITDTVPDMYYMTAQQIYRLFNDSATGQDKVTLAIAGARICDTNAINAPSNVKDIDNENKTTEFQYADGATNYDDISATDPNVLMDNGTITFTWESGKLVIKRAAYGSTPAQNITLNSLSPTAIQDALDQLGYVVTPAATYDVSWKIVNNQIDGGHTEKRTLPVTVKDDFMLLNSDVHGSNNLYTISTNVAKVVNNGSATNVPDTSIVARRQWSIKKDATVNGKPIEVASITPSTVIDYALVVDRLGGTKEYDALPLVDEMHGPQVLLVPVIEQNAHLVGQGAKLVTYDGVQYYSLETPGTYTPVWFNAEEAVGLNATARLAMAESVKVTANGGAGSGITTHMTWYLDTSELANPGQLTVHYNVVPDPAKADFSTSEDEEGLPVSNDGYLGDHESQRLHAGSGPYEVPATGSDKKIVRTRGATPDEDVLIASSNLTDQTKTVTYRLTITHAKDGAEVLTGADLYDALPKSVASNPWVSGDIVSVTYDTTAKAADGVTPALQVSNPNSWSVVNTLPSYITGTADDADATQQYLVWDKNTTFTINGESYIYVTLRLPEGINNQDWIDWAHAYNTSTLYNTFYVKNNPSKVSHTMGGAGKAILQKGVVETGTISGTVNGTILGTPRISYRGLTHAVDASKNGRYYYIPSRSATSWIDTGYMVYNVTIANDGEGLLYLDDIVDVMPQGTVYVGGVAVTSGHESSTDVSQYEETDDGNVATNAHLNWTADASVLNDLPVTLSDANTTLIGKRAGVHAIVDNASGKIVFKLDNDCRDRSLGTSQADGNLSYDSDLNKYYLTPGEVVSFNYMLYTGTLAQSAQVETNTVGMKYYDYNGAGVKLADVDITSKEYQQNVINDGVPQVVGGAYANKEGLTAANNPNDEWLMSSVSLYQQKIAPGVSKELTGRQIDKTTMLTDEESLKVIGYRDTLQWTVTAHNDSNTPVLDYVISDEIMKPYRFTGALDLSVYNANGSKVSNTGGTLLTFGEWHADGKSVDVTCRTTDWATDQTKTLTVDGDPLAVRGLSGNGNALVYQVRLVSTETGVRLDVRTPPTSPLAGNEGDGGSGVVPSIPANGTVKLVVNTNNPIASTTTPDFRTVYNEGYLTPLTQNENYDENKVTKGEVLDIDIKFRGANGDNTYSTWTTSTTLVNMHLNSIVAEATVSVATDSSTASTKMVEEKEDPTNEATSTSKPNHITLEDQGSPFTYTLQVENLKQNPMTSLVLIDNLSQVGDSYTFSNLQRRRSQFAVSLASNPNFRIEVLKPGSSAYETVPASAYRLEYSTTTTFDSSDWSGADTGKWNASAAEARAFRIVFDTEQIDQWVTGEAVVRVRFDAKASPGQVIPSGSIAWNSFGYQCTLSNSTNPLQAIPLKVGVAVPGAITIEKHTAEMVDKDTRVSKPVPAGYGAGEYQFIIYEGSRINTLDSDFSNEELAALLEEEGRAYTLVTVPLDTAAANSEIILVSDNVQYSYNAASQTWTEKLDENTGLPLAWKWVENGTYTILELASEDVTHFYSLESGNFTLDTAPSNRLGTIFTYSAGKNITFQAINTFSKWDAYTIKYDGPSVDKSPEHTWQTQAAKLTGAGFALYTTVPTETISDDTFNDFLHANNLMAGDVPKTVVYEGVTYHLYQLKVTTYEEGGIIGAKWTNLHGDTYVVKEVSAPQGYGISDTGLRPLRQTDLITPISTPPMTSPGQSGDDDTVIGNYFIDYPGYTLPHTGGSSTWVLYVGAIIFAILAGMLVENRVVKRRRNGTGR